MGKPVILHTAKELKEIISKILIDNDFDLKRVKHPRNKRQLENTRRFYQSIIMQLGDKKLKNKEALDLVAEAKVLMEKLLPSEEYGESGDCEALYNIIEQLGKGALRA
jgi:hypothetical protein